MQRKTATRRTRRTRRLGAGAACCKVRQDNTGQHRAGQETCWLLCCAVLCCWGQVGSPCHAPSCVSPRLILASPCFLSSIQYTMHHATTPIGIQLSDSILRPKHSPSTRKVDNIFVLNVRAHHKSEFSRRKSLGGCSTMASLTEALIAVKALFEKAMSVRGQNGGQASFRNARNETINLKNVNLESVFLVLQQAITPNARAEARRETKLCFDALRSVMRMHACECIDIVEYSSSCYLCTLYLCTDSREKQMLLRLICVASQNFIFQALFSCFIINYVFRFHAWGHSSAGHDTSCSH